MPYIPPSHDDVNFNLVQLTQPIFTEVDFQFQEESGTTVKYYNGTAWVDSLIKFHNGTEFIDAASIRSIT